MVALYPPEQLSVFIDPERIEPSMEASREMKDNAFQMGNS